MTTKNDITTSPSTHDAAHPAPATLANSRPQRPRHTLTTATLHDALNYTGLNTTNPQRLLSPYNISATYIILPACDLPPNPSPLTPAAARFLRRSIRYAIAAQPHRCRFQTKLIADLPPDILNAPMPILRLMPPSTPHHATTATATTQHHSDICQLLLHCQINPAEQLVYLKYLPRQLRYLTAKKPKKPHTRFTYHQHNWKERKHTMEKEVNAAVWPLNRYNYHCKLLVKNLQNACVLASDKVPETLNIPPADIYTPLDTPPNATQPPQPPVLMTGRKTSKYKRCANAWCGRVRPNTPCYFPPLPHAAADQQSPNTPQLSAFCRRCWQVAEAVKKAKNPNYPIDELLHTSSNTNASNNTENEQKLVIY